MPVTVDSAMPNSDTSEHVTWNSAGVPAHTANLYVSKNQSVIADPNKMTVQASGLGRISNYAVDVNNLTAGTDYYCVGDADGVPSPDNPGYKFKTTGGVAATAHLVSTGDKIQLRVGEDADVAVKVEKIGQPGSSLPGINVTFAVTGGSGGGNLNPTNANSDGGGIAKVNFKATKAGNVQITASSASADNKVVIPVTVQS